MSGYQIGSDRTNGGRNWNGVIGEVLSFSSKLSDTDRKKVEGYLAHKWGVANTLDSNHTYKDVPPIFDNKPLIGNLRSISNSSPKEIAGISLWLDASELSTADTTWTNKSGSGNHASKNGSPTVVTNAQMGYRS